MPGKHTLHIFDEDLATLRGELLKLATQVEDELRRAVEALLRGDKRLGQDVMDSDAQADALQLEVNRHTARILARQQAMAGDLREILAADRIAAHVERVGDYAKNTARRAQRLTQPLDAEIAAQLRWMGERVGAMLHRVMDAYARNDAAEANVAWTSDAELDALYGTLFEHLLKHMRIESQDVADGTQLLFIAKGMERAGDHVTDIAEEVFYMVTGTPLQGERTRLEPAPVVPD
jgi:phosphate transport system protein